MIIPIIHKTTLRIAKLRPVIRQGFFIIPVVCVLISTPFAIAQTTAPPARMIDSPASVGSFTAYAWQDSSDKPDDKPDRKTVQIKITRDGKTGLLYATIKGRKLQARLLSYLEKEAQKAYPDYTIQLVDAKSGHTFTMPRTMLGVILQPISGVVASQLNIKDGEAIIIDECFSGLPADRAHLQKYDIILSCDGKRPISKQSFTQILNRAEPGDRLNLIVLRGGQEVEIEVPLAAYDPIIARRLGNTDSTTNSSMRFDPLNNTPTTQNNSTGSTQQRSMRADMNRLMIQLQDQDRLLPMELAGATSSNSSALMGARTSDIEGRLVRMQKQMDHIEQLLSMMLQCQYGPPHQTPSPLVDDTTTSQKRK